MQKSIKMTLDPRLLADWDGKGWAIAKGEYGIASGDSAEALSSPVTVSLKARVWTDRAKRSRSEPRGG